MLRDRQVVGIADAGLSERLQLNPDLTLEKAKKIVRQKEAVAELNCRLIGEQASQTPLFLNKSNMELATKGARVEATNKSQGRVPGSP